MSNQVYAKELLSAKTEGDVTALIEDLEHAYDVTWRPIGQQENNYGMVEAQPSAPMAALNEIISNAIDAVLRKKYRERHGDEYDPAHGLDSYFDAAEELLRGSTEEEVRIIADGSKGGPWNLTVRDTGEGQTPEDFEDTFVGLLKPGMAKQGWPFLQGQFGMGSTGVLPHCGDAGYKAIFTAGMENPGVWTWTLIRKNRDGNAYEYICLDGKPPTFEGELADGDVGSFVKMFNYQTRNKSNITSEFQFKLARYITRTPIPILLDERRDYSSYRTKETLTGYQGLMENQSGYVKREKTVHYDFGGRVGKRPVQLAIFKSDTEVEEDPDLVYKNKKRMFTSRRKASQRAVFFTVNGQVHGDLGLSFVKNRCDLYHIGSDLVAFVDFSDLGTAEFVDLFRASRDRLADKPMAQRLRDGMESILTTDSMLKEEEQRRRERFTKDKREEKMGDMLEDLIERNPDLLDYLTTGEQVPSLNESSSVKESDYTAPHNPDTFEIIVGRDDDGWQFYEGEGRYQKDMPTNRNRWARFYLNAPNDFFDRPDDTGDLRIVPSEVVRSYALRDGLLSVQLEPLPESDPGMSLPVSISVESAGMDGRLEQNIQVNYNDPIDEVEDPGGENDLPPVRELDIPPTNPIYQEDWDEFPEPFDAHTPVRIEGSGEDMLFHINYDAAPVKNFLSRYKLRKTGKETVKETWKAGVVMYTLSTYIELRKEFDDREDIPPKSIAEVSMRGVVQSMLDQHISTTELEELRV